MIKPYTKNMTDKQKQDILIQTFGRLKADPEDEDFQDVIVKLAAEVNCYRHRIHELQYEYERQIHEHEQKMQRHDEISSKVFESMKKKILSKDQEASESKSIEYQADLEEIAKTMLLEAGIELSKTAWDAFKKEMSWNEQTPRHILTHQVGLQHQKKLFEALCLDSQKNFSTFETLGNTGSAALPISLCRAAEEKRFRANDKILLMGIGSGLSTLMLGMVWQE